MNIKTIKAQAAAIARTISLIDGIDEDARIDMEAAAADIDTWIAELGMVDAAWAIESAANAASEMGEDAAAEAGWTIAGLMAVTAQAE